MTVNQERIKSLIFTIVPLIIAVFIMLPRLISPQFGLFDDGSMLVEVNRFIEHDWSMAHDIQAGRFRPVYWLYFLILLSSAGATPFWFFFGHLILFLIVIIEIRILMQRMRASNWQILITSLIFIFSIPIIENFYTLSKGEPLQLVFVLGSIIFLSEIKAPASKMPRWVSVLGAFISILLALMVKETTMIIIPMAIACLGFTLLNKKYNLKEHQKAYLLFSGSALAAIIFYIILRNLWGATTLTGGTYTESYSISLQSLFTQSLRWITLLAHYFHYLLPLTSIALFSYFKNKPDDFLKHELIFWVVWVGSWIVVLLPWEYAKAYYLLPFSLGISILIGLTFPQIFTMISRAKNVCRCILISGLALAAILFLSTLSHYRTHAQTQLIFDRTNQDMLSFVKEVAPTNSAVYTSIDQNNEYITNITLFLANHYRRTDITSGFIDLETLEHLPQASNTFILMPVIVNQPNLLVRAGVIERFTMPWNQVVLGKLDHKIQLINTYNERFRIFNINLPVILCPILGERGFCEMPDPLIDTREFSYGWEIYKIK
ncbi:MAG: hypothetical protein GX142_04860 [Chloroflexi bacterium]|nr:hypothetical protein [Chloroflexota bacterium]